MDLQQIDQYRLELAGVDALAARDIGPYVQSLAGEAPERVAQQVRAAAPVVVEAYGDVAAVTAAQFYEAQSPKLVTARLATPPLDTLQDELSWAVTPLFKPDLASTVAVRTVAVVGKFIQAFAHSTIELNVDSDPFARGSKRFARAGACAFCVYLSSEAVYIPPGARKWHTNCHCVEVPYWDDNPLPRHPKQSLWDSAVADAAGSIREEAAQKRRELADEGVHMRSRQFYAAYPELAVNTRNITGRVRQILNLAH